MYNSILEFLRKAEKPVTITEVCQGIENENRSEVGETLASMVKEGTVFRNYSEGIYYFTLDATNDIGKNACQINLDNLANALNSLFGVASPEVASEPVSESEPTSQPEVEPEGETSSLSDLADLLSSVSKLESLLMGEEDSVAEVSEEDIAKYSHEFTYTENLFFENDLYRISIPDGFKIAKDYVEEATLLSDTPTKREFVAWWPAEHNPDSFMASEFKIYAGAMQNVPEEVKKSPDRDTFKTTVDKLITLSAGVMEKSLGNKLLVRQIDHEQAIGGYFTQETPMFDGSNIQALLACPDGLKSIRMDVAVVPEEYRQVQLANAESILKSFAPKKKIKTLQEIKEEQEQEKRRKAEEKKKAKEEEARRKAEEEQEKEKLVLEAVTKAKKPVAIKNVKTSYQGKKLHENEVKTYIDKLIKKEELHFIQYDGDTYYAAVSVDLNLFVKEREEEKQRKREEKEIARKENIYKNACEHMGTEYILLLEEAAKDLRTIPDYKDASQKANEIDAKIAAIKAKAEAKKKKKRNILIVVLVVIVILIMLPILNNNVFKPNKEYRQAEKLFEAGQYEDAIEAFEDLYDYKDAEARVVQVQAAWDCSKLENALSEKEYGNVANYLNKTKADQEFYAVACEAVYNAALELQDTDAATAQNLLQFLPKDYKDVSELIGTMGQEATYQAAMEALNGKDYVTAEALFGQIPGYKDADVLLEDTVNYQIYNNALALEEKGLVQSALAAYQSLPEEFADVAERIAALQPQIGAVVEGEGATTPEGEATVEGEETAEQEAEATE